jgi:hypothetical protein
MPRMQARLWMSIAMLCALAHEAAFAASENRSDSVPIRVYCSAAASGVQTVSFGLPLARDALLDASQISLQSGNGLAVAVDATELARWRHLKNPDRDARSIRAALLSFRHDCGRSAQAAYTVRIGVAPSKRAGLGVTPLNVASNWIVQAKPLANEHPQTDNYQVDSAAAAIFEPPVWVQLPQQWLARASIRAAITGALDPQWVERLVAYGKTYVNDVALDVSQFENNDGKGLINWSTEVEGWLYDRPFVLFNVYVATGDVKWLRHAHRAGQYYANWIARSDSKGGYLRGAFTKKPPAYADDVGDSKYSLNGGLFAAYLLTGDARLLEPIQAIADFVSAKVTTRLLPWTQVNGLWTERQIAVAINAAVYAYEATGQTKYRDRALSIVTGMKEDVVKPPPGYPSAQEMAGVLWHRKEVHEGSAGAEAAFVSPWMSALMIEALMHYHLLSDDRVAMQFAADYAQLVAHQAIYNDAAQQQLATLWYPYYGIHPTQGVSEGGSSTDMEHAPDVRSLLIHGKRALALQGRDTTMIDNRITQLYRSQEYVFDAWHRNTTGLARYRLSPTRKYAWWFSDLAGGTQVELK